MKLCGYTVYNNELNQEEQINKVIDAVANYLIKKGIKANGEPNSLGIELENLIDKLNQY